MDRNGLNDSSGSALKGQLIKYSKIAAGAVGGVVAAAAIFSSFYVTGSGENAIVETLGKLDGVKGPGLNFKVPFVSEATKYFTGVKDIEIEQIRPDCKTADAANKPKANDGTTYTKDQQLVYASTKAQVALQAGEPLIKIHTKYRNYEALVRSYIEKAQKDTLGTYNTVDIPASRGKITGEMDASIKDQIKKEGLPVLVSGVQLKNFDVSCQYEAQVEKAAQAKTELTRKETELQSSRVDKDKSIVAAEAKRQEAVLAGEGKASQILAEATAEAKGVALMQDALAKSSLIVDYTKAKNWNGALPGNIFAGAPIPFFDATQTIGSSRPGGAGLPVPAVVPAPK